MAEAATWVSPFLYGVGSLKCKGPWRGWEAAPSPTPPGGASLPRTGRGRGPGPGGRGGRRWLPPWSQVKTYYSTTRRGKTQGGGAEKSLGSGSCPGGGSGFSGGEEAPLTDNVGDEGDEEPQQRPADDLDDPVAQ